MKKQRINLMPKEALPQRGLRNEHAIITLFTGLITYVLISYPLLLSSSRKTRAELDQLEVTQKKLKGDYAYLSQESAPQNSEETQLNIFRTLISRRSDLGKAFQELSLLPISEVWLNHLKSTRADGSTSISLKGISVTREKIASYFTALEKSYYFRNVRLKNVEEVSGLLPKQFSFEFSIEIPKTELKTEKEGAGGKS